MMPIYVMSAIVGGFLLFGGTVAQILDMMFAGAILLFIGIAGVALDGGP